MPADKTSTSAPSSSPAQHDPSADTEPLLHLFKMSPTAGQGNQEYVAVNVAAVVAVLFGVASVLAVLGNILLIIPVTGVVLAIVALRQIHNSNGTQTGKGLAWIALVLAGGITVTLFSVRGVEIFRRHDDALAIDKLCRDFGQLVSDGKFDDAYPLFDAKFHHRVALGPFKIHLATIQRGAQFPPIDRIRWNQLAAFHTNDEGVTTGEGMIVVHFKDDREDSQAVFFRKEGDTWKFDNIPDLFPDSPGTGDNSAPPQ